MSKPSKVLKQKLYSNRITFNAIPMTKSQWCIRKEILLIAVQNTLSGLISLLTLGTVTLAFSLKSKHKLNSLTSKEVSKGK